MKKTILFLALGFLLTGKTLFAQVPSYVPTNGLVGYWPFNGNANDESGNGNNGVVNGASLTSDKFSNANSAMQFGQNQYIEVPNLRQNNINSYSISAWFRRPQSSINNDGAVVSGSYPGQTPGGLRLNIGTINRFQWQIEDSPGQNGILQLAPGDNNNYCDNNWHLVVSTFSSLNGLVDSSAFKLYVDGVFVQTISNLTNWPTWDTTTYAPINNGNRSTIIGNCGGNFYNFSNSFLGTLDDIGIWDRALTEQEITNLYNSANTNECLTMVINTGVLSPTPVTYTSSVSIYPNPANDQITIDCGNLANVTGWSIKITNMLGQEVFNQPMNTQQYVVPLNTWSGQGMYFVKIINALNEVVNIKKIILQ